MSKRIRLGDWHRSLNTEKIAIDQLKAESCKVNQSTSYHEQEVAFESGLNSDQNTLLLMYQQLSILHKRHRQEDIKFWLEISKNEIHALSTIAISSTLKINANLYVLFAQLDVEIWLNVGWIREQFLLKRELKYIHPSLENIRNADEVIAQILDLIGRRGCQIFLINTIELEAAKLFTVNHEWVEVIEKNRVKIGISDYAQKSLGDLVYVELPDTGTRLDKSQSLGIVESVKGASDIYAPISGKILITNEKVLEKPSLINKKPEGEGWLCEMDIEDANQIDELLTECKYEEFCQGKSKENAN